MLPSLQCRTGQAVALQGRPRSCKSLLSTLPVRRRVRLQYHVLLSAAHHCLEASANPRDAAQVPHRSTCRPCAASNSLFDSPLDSMFADLDREMTSFQRQVCLWLWLQ